MSTQNEVQAAVVAALRGNTDLVAIVGERIYDDLPHSEENLDTSFPRVSIGLITESEYGAQDVDMSQFTIVVDCYSRGHGKKQCSTMMHAVRKAVIGDYAQKSHAASIVSMMFDLADGPRRENDGKTYHGYVRFRGLIQYG